MKIGFQISSYYKKFIYINVQNQGNQEEKQAYKQMKIIDFQKIKSILSAGA
jgi:hypothetical protein